MGLSIEVVVGLGHSLGTSCDRTAQFIQDEVRLSPLTRWHTHTFTFGQTSYLVQKSTLFLGQRKVLSATKYRVSIIFRHFLHLRSTRTLHNFCWRVQLELFEQGYKVWLTSYVFQSLDKTIHAKIWLIISCDFLIPNFMKLFHGSRWMHGDVMYM